MTLAVLDHVPTMPSIGRSSSGRSFSELHSAALITSEEHSRAPTGRLAARVPSLDNGDISISADGSMRVAYRLRPGITWHNGHPFSAQDLLFSYQFSSDPGIPFGFKSFLALIDSAEAPDDATFVVNFSTTYYLADRLGLESLWPLPRHLLGQPFESYLATRDSDAILNLTYWTSDYVNLGPFAVAAFDPADIITLRAYDGYFLGRPKLDTIYLKIFTDANSLYANLLAGQVDMFLDNTVSPNHGFELMIRWQQSGEGTVYLLSGASRYLSPQLRAAIQIEPAVLEVPVRAALYAAVDREAISEALQGGHRELAAYEILPPVHSLYAATKDSMRRYAYDPQRARAGLAEADWTLGTDGRLRNNRDGRSFRAPIWGTAGRDREQETAAIADYWRRVGLETQEAVIPPAQVRNPEYRATFPGWEVSSGGEGDQLLQQIQGPAATSDNRWMGNRRGYEDPRTDELIKWYRSSLAPEQQAEAIKAITDVVVEQLPFLMLYYTAYHVGVSNRVVALADQDGGGAYSADYGTFSRNGHLWELR